MKLFTIAITLLFLSACSSFMQAKNDEIERLVIMALDSHKKGNLTDALKYYELALKEIDDSHFASSTSEVSRPWEHLKAQVLYEKGLDKTLIEFTDEKLERDLALKWWCHILERRGKLHDAENCWTVYGDAERMTRVIRSKEVIKAFTPSETRFGYVGE